MAASTPPADQCCWRGISLRGESRRQLDVSAERMRRNSGAVSQTITRVLVTIIPALPLAMSPFLPAHTGPLRRPPLAGVAGEAGITTKQTGCKRVKPQNSSPSSLVIRASTTLEIRVQFLPQHCAPSGGHTTSRTALTNTTSCSGTREAAGVQQTIIPARGSVLIPFIASTVPPAAPSWPGESMSQARHFPFVSACNFFFFFFNVHIQVYFSGLEYLAGLQLRCATETLSWRCKLDNKIFALLYSCFILYSIISWRR